MTDTTQGSTAPEAEAAGTGAAPFSVGTTLREARMQQGLSVEDVSGRIKFAPRQIEALEADDFAHVPENAFLRGFVRSYARLLQLDAEHLVAALPHEPESGPALQEPRAAEETPYPGVYDERKSNIIWLAGALGVAVLIGLFAWLLSGKPKEQRAEMKETQGMRVETLDLPAAVPVSAVPDAELAAHLSGSAEKSQPAAVPPPVKMEQDKPKDEKQGEGKSAAEKNKTAEVKKAPQALPASAVAPAKVAPATDKKASASPVPATATLKSPAATPTPVADKKQPVPSAAVATPAKPVVPASAVPPAKVRQGESSPKSSGSGPIRVAFDADSWVEIKDADGKIVMSLLGHNGTEQSTGGKAPFSVTVGYASGVKLYYKGKQVDLAPHARSEVAHLTLE